ncbi:MAG: hypothetical protein ACREVI_12930 [Steroidobacteraceae bacterium]
MSLTITRAAACLAWLLPVAALAGQPVDVTIFDRTDGRELPVYWHQGERHVAGEPGHEYEVRIRNRSHSRMLAVTSVDGVNVITGRTASTGQGGYVLDPHGRLAIDGWRKNMDEVAAFYFTALPDSYAARTGRPDHVGVIGLALFRERVDYRERKALDAAAPEPAAGRERESSASASEIHRDESRLGTGHGQRLDSGAVYTDFERASETPDTVIRIFYDSRRNLVAQGVIPRPLEGYARRTPEPFPDDFVPDP